MKQNKENSWTEEQNTETMKNGKPYTFICKKIFFNNLRYLLLEWKYAMAALPRTAVLISSVTGNLCYQHKRCQSTYPETIQVLHVMLKSWLQQNEWSHASAAQTDASPQLLNHIFKVGKREENLLTQVVNLHQLSFYKHSYSITPKWKEVILEVCLIYSWDTLLNILQKRQ